MTHNDLRQKYLDFYKKREHQIIPSFSLVPENDPSTLFNSSGMQPLIEYFLGQPHPLGSRIVDSQRCIRTQDILEVGDNRHTTYFEMLGNWSFGDYFKSEQLPWVFEFLTQIVGLDPHKLYVTVFAGNEKLNLPRDTESVSIWQEIFAKVGIKATVGNHPVLDGLKNDRIFYYDETKNWWSRSGTPQQMPGGEPGGPDSEVFYDFGSHLKLHENSQYKDQPCHVNCDCGRFLEIGNSVFMQYQKNEDGTFAELPAKNVDFGGGLERILAAKNNDSDVFKTDIFLPIIKVIEKLSGLEYESATEQQIVSMRVIADHLRAAFMLASDGVIPSNKEQGYILRRLIRRAVRHGKMIGINQPFVGRVSQAVGQVYTQLLELDQAKIDSLSQIIDSEEQKFLRTLEKGLRELEKLDQIDGQVAFKIYETYGFPLELTQEIAVERGLIVNEEEFIKSFEEHKEKSRSGSAQKFKGGLADHSEQVVKYHTATHLLHAALRLILGKSVQQKGSNITAERCRFDFSFDRALTDEEIKKVESQINDWISQDLKVTKETMPKDEALKSGAMAFFGEKYPDQVTVYTIWVSPPTHKASGDSRFVSRELCGGPHVTTTGQIGQIEIFKEQALGAGMRRIYLRDRRTGNQENGQAGKVPR